MKCPSCSNDMEKGKMHSRGGMFFLPDGETPPKLHTEREMKKHNAICLQPNMLDTKPEYPTAYVCRLCSKIIIEY